jgi:hypothetical protein
MASVKYICNEKILTKSKNNRYIRKMMGTEMVPETSVVLNEMTRLIGQRRLY